MGVHRVAVTTATGQEHEDSNGGGDFKDVTMEASVGGGGDAACLTAGDRIQREGEREFGND